MQGSVTEVRSRAVYNIVGTCREGGGVAELWSNGKHAYSAKKNSNLY